DRDSTNRFNSDGSSMCEFSSGGGQTALHIQPVPAPGNSPDYFWEPRIGGWFQAGVTYRCHSDGRMLKSGHDSPAADTIATGCDAVARCIR
ncbi:MAG: hypothetical protein ACI91J_001513, partial [Yoonia sp.]